MGSEVVAAWVMTPAHSRRPAGRESGIGVGLRRTEIRARLELTGPMQDNGVDRESSQEGQCAFDSCCSDHMAINLNSDTALQEVDRDHQ